MTHNMLTEERHAAILNELHLKGFIQVSALAQQLGVNPITIRRDLLSLEEQGRCVRTRGGAIQVGEGALPELPYEIKARQHVEEKLRIARAAMKVVDDGDIIILDSGSTMYKFAEQLVTLRRLTVVTNDIKIAGLLAVNPSITLICTGGTARANVYTLLGSQTEQFLRAVRVKKTFLAADAIHTDGTISNVNMEEIAVKQAMITAAGEVILLADSSKFLKTGFANVCDLKKIDLVITDVGIPAEWQIRLKEWQVKTELV
jgi:DeoR/GlpR family transcriptional regulator of sugar metabolism